MPSRTGRPWRRIRDRIIRRDGGICHICGNPGATTADHIIPVSLGGTDNPSNLRAAHPYCNRVRGNGPITTARQRVLGETPTGWDW